MAAKGFRIIKITKDKSQIDDNIIKNFTMNFQEALLLSLLGKNLLTQRQFERCVEEIKRK